MANSVASRSKRWYVIFLSDRVKHAPDRDVGSGAHHDGSRIGKQSCCRLLNHLSARSTMQLICDQFLAGTRQQGPEQFWIDRVGQENDRAVSHQHMETTLVHVTGLGKQV